MTLEYTTYYIRTSIMFPFDNPCDSIDSYVSKKIGTTSYYEEKTHQKNVAYI